MTSLSREDLVADESGKDRYQIAREVFDEWCEIVPSEERQHFGEYCDQQKAEEEE